MKKNLLYFKLFLLCSLTSNLDATYTCTIEPEWINTKFIHKTKHSKISLEKIPADLAYWIADIKLKNDGLKIIEFGDGNFAGYKVLNHMYYPGKVWKNIWEHFFKFNKPIWYIGQPQNEDRKAAVAWKLFRESGGLHETSLQRLANNRIFLEQIASKSHQMSKKIEDYKAIIFLFQRNKKALNELKSFLKKYPQALVLNGISSPYVHDKYKTDQLFNTPKLREFRPNALSLEKKYSPLLSEEILTKIESEWLVIKPVNSGRGNGIIMTNRADLESNLQKILITNRNTQTPDNTYSFKPNTPLAYDYWKYDRNSHFLVEEYAESKPIIVNQKPYDATARVVFVIQYEQGTISLKILQAYWKRPLVALNEPGTFKEKHISKHAPTFEESQGLGVSPEDFKLIEKYMAQCLPQIYWNILQQQ